VVANTADAVAKLTIDDTKVKSKNLDVVDEFEKSKMKRMANFVVVGTLFLLCIDAH